MRFQRAIPAGPPDSPENLFTGLQLEQGASSDRPYVVCNFVSSSDGKATASGRTAQLGGDGDRVAFHLLRTQVDAVLVGTGTLRVERYGALVRQPHLAEIRQAEGRAAQPLAAIVSRSGNVPFEIPLFSAPGSRIALYGPKALAVPSCPAEVITHELPPGGSEMAAALRSLRQDHDVRSLLFEGGPTLFNSMLADGLVDELFLTLAPTIVGGGELGITAGAALPAPLPLQLVWSMEHDGTLFLRYRL
jgi:riboflavin biosynthesis pyrimidine reductase